MTEFRMESVSNSPVDTVGCRYNAVQYNTILYIPLQWLGKNTNQSLIIKKCTTYFALTGEPWGNQHIIRLRAGENDPS